MKFNNINEIRDKIASQDPLACNICQAVLNWIWSRGKLWIVTTDESTAIVYGKNVTEAVENAGFDSNTLRSSENKIQCEEIDPDNPGRFFEKPSHRRMIIKKEND